MPTQPPSAFAVPSLAGAWQRHFPLGVAVWPEGRTPDARDLALVTRHFRQITPENVMKWRDTEPEEGTFTWAAADACVAFARRHGLDVHGHCLLWHHRLPSWVEVDKEGAPVPVSRLRQRLVGRIATLAGRYRGKVRSWDVVNEAILDDGSWRPTVWHRTLGPEFVAAAFHHAARTDPDARLGYNDFNCWKPAKRDAIVQLHAEVAATGARLDLLGMQAHYTLTEPPLEAIEAALDAFASTGARIAITELDVDVLPGPGSGGELEASGDPGATDLDPSRDGLPDAVQEALATRYADLFRLFRRYARHIAFVTFWGIHDGCSWRNSFPLRGRTNHALLFDRLRQPKAAFHAVRDVGQATR